MTVASLRRCLAVLEARLDLQPRWRGAELDRLLDEGHARLQSAWAARLLRWGWETRAEASFNHYGDRGRVDLLAWHAASGVLLVVEVKTEVADIQSLLGRMDVKQRVAHQLAAGAGWPRPRLVVGAIVVSDTTTNRRRLRAVDALLVAYPRRGKRAISWLRRPNLEGGGLLVHSILSSAATSRVRRDLGGHARVRAGGMSVGSALLDTRARADTT
jgi:hypothetical protein